jgi:hypothetical protein
LCRLRFPTVRLVAPVATGVLPTPTISIGRTVTVITTALWTLSTSAFGWGSDRPNPSLDSSFASHSSKEPGLGLAEHDEFRVVLGHTQEIEDCFFRLDQRLAAGFHPIHLLPSLSVTF